MSIIPLSAHARPIYPTHFAGNPYTAQPASRLQLLPSNAH